MGINSIDNQYYNAFLPAKQAATSSVDNPIKEELQISFGDTKNIESDVFEKEENTPADGKDDGSIGFWGALKSFGKGALNFFKGMVCDENGNFSLKQTLKTAGMIAGIGLLTLVPVIGPLVLPALCIYGIYEGGKIAYEGAQKANNATTDAEAEQAWEEIGTGATEGILSAAGYKATGGIRAAFGKSKAQFMSIKNRFSKAPEPPLELAEKTSPSETTSAENSTTSRSGEESSATTSTTEEVATQKTTATRTPEEVAEIYERTKKQLEKSRQERARSRAKADENMSITPEDMAKLKELAKEYDTASFDSKLIGKDPSLLSEIEKAHLEKFKSLIKQFKDLVKQKNKIDSETYAARKDQIAQEWLEYCKENNLYTDALEGWKQKGRQLIKHYFFKFLEDPARMGMIEKIVFELKQNKLNFDSSSIDSFSTSTKNLLKFITEKTSEDLSHSKTQKCYISDGSFAEQFSKIEKSRNGNLIKTTYSYIGNDKTGVLIISTEEGVDTIMITYYSKYLNRLSE